MEFDQKEETPFNIPEKKKTDKKNIGCLYWGGCNNGQFAHFWVRKLPSDLFQGHGN